MTSVFSAGVRVLIDQPVVLHGCDTAAGADVDAHAHGALMQVGFAVGGPGCQAQHAHDRVAAEHDDADVRDAFVRHAGDLLADSNPR